MSTSPTSAPPRDHVPPAVRNGLLRAEELPPVAALPDDVATRTERYARLSAWLGQWEQAPHDDEPDWDVDELVPADGPR